MTKPSGVCFTRSFYTSIGLLLANMEKPPSLFLKLSLEEMVLRRVVVNLFSGADVSASVQNFRIKTRYSEIKNKNEWQAAVEEKVKAKVSNLPSALLPSFLKKQMMQLVSPIGEEILRWKLFYTELDAVVPELLCWTPAGVVDDKKTAEKVVRLERFDVAKRYRLACLYCLDDCLPALWEDLPEEKRQEFVLVLDRYYNISVDLEVYWAYVLRGEKSNLDSVISERFGVHETYSSSHQCAFESSVCARNKAATEYFFHQLTSEEREASLARAANEVADKSVYQYYAPYTFTLEDIPGVLCYLLSVMSREQKIQVTAKSSYEILKLFLIYWPWRDLFLDIAQLVMTFLPEKHYRLMLINISSHVVKAGRYFPNLIQKFFLLIPAEFRVHFALCLCFFFPDFLSNEDAETLKVFLRNVDPKRRERLILESKFARFLCDLVSRDEWHLLQVCVRETSLSKDEKEELKVAFLNEFRQANQEDKKIRLKRFMEILDENEVRV